MKSVHFYAAVLGLAAGIGVETIYRFSVTYFWWLVVIGFGLFLIKRRQQNNSYYRTTVMLVFVIFMAVGASRVHLATLTESNTKLETLLGQKIERVGLIVREPDARDTLTHLYVRVDDELLLVSTDRHQKFSYGQEVKVSGELSKPESFTTDLGRTFDYRGYLLARGVSYQINFAKVEILHNAKGNLILADLFSAKQRFIRTIERFLAEPEASLAEGLLLGVKQGLGEDLEAAFRQTGIIHIVVLSGYNIMIVVAFVMYLLRSILPTKWQVLLGIIAIAIFAILVGLSATVVRASIMASSLLLVGLAGRGYLALRGLFLAGAIMLIINPYLMVFDAGFQLSFLATLGLILLTPLFLPYLGWVPEQFGIREFAVATIATQIMVLPFLLFTVGEFSIVAVLVNVLVLPMVPAAMLLTFLVGLTGIVLPPLSLAVSFLAHLSLAYIITVAITFAQLPLAALAVPAFPFYMVLLAYAGIFYVIYRVTRVRTEVVDIDLSNWLIVTEQRT